MIPWTREPGSTVARPKTTGESKIQHIRIPDEDWLAFNKATGGKGAATVRAFIGWYLRRRGAAMPKRPEATRDSGE
jgi:hypothetical protein